MNLAWEHEVWKALRAAEVLFELPKSNWLGAVHTQEQMDPSKAMESLFSQLLDNHPYSDSNSALETGETEMFPSSTTSAAHDLRQQPASPIARTHELLSPSSQAEGVFRQSMPSDPEPDTNPKIESNPHFATHEAIDLPKSQSNLANHDRSESLPVSGNRDKILAFPRQAAIPMSESTSPQAAYRHEETHGQDPAAFSKPAPPDSNGIRQTEASEVALATASDTLSTSVFSNTEAMQGSRLVTELSDLQGLFRSVVADSQSKEKSILSKALDSEQDSGSSASDHMDSAGKVVEAPWPSFESATSGILDPAWEEFFLDRLLDRWEERLREQAIRHLGFTGGLT